MLETEFDENSSGDFPVRWVLPFTLRWAWRGEVQELKGLVARCGVQVHNKVSALWMDDG